MRSGWRKSRREASVIKESLHYRTRGRACYAVGEFGTVNRPSRRTRSGRANRIGQTSSCIGQSRRPGKINREKGGESRGGKSVGKGRVGEAFIPGKNKAKRTSKGFRRDGRESRKDSCRRGKGKRKKKSKRKRVKKRGSFHKNS